MNEREMSCIVAFCTAIRYLLDMGGNLWAEMCRAKICGAESCVGGNLRGRKSVGRKPAGTPKHTMSN